MVVDEGLYPFGSHFFEKNGLKQHYLDEGSGPVVVMVHGNPTWSFYYRNLVLALRENYRCIVPDHIGCGLSDKPGDDRYEYTLARRIDDLEALLDHLDLGNEINLVVHDWGGMIGMGYAHRHPDRIAKLTILNTGAFHLPQTKKFPLALWIVRNTFLGAFLVRGFNGFSLVASYICCRRKKLDRKLRRAFRAPYDSWANRIATLRFVQDIPLEPKDKAYAVVSEIQEGLQRFTETPMLICWGEKDFVFSTHFLDEWIRRFPDADVLRFSDGGHYILEDASEEVIPRIRAFLSSQPVRKD